MLMNVQNKEDIFARMAEHSSRLGSYGVERYGLFGSFVRSEQNLDSDVDILVEFRPDAKTFDNFMNLSFFLEEILGRKVDIVTRESLSRHIGPNILAEIEYGVIDI